MSDIRASAGATALAEPSVTDDFDDEFSLDVRIVVTSRTGGKPVCPTNDGCGQTCQNGASACNSFIEDPS